ncbi:MAG: preprotein translocase subunit SecE, partial [Planctomycetota bacterium]
SGPSPKRASGNPFQVYKPGQGQMVRWGTAAGAGVLIVACGNFLYEQLAFFGLTTQAAVSVGAMVVLSWLTFRLVGQNRKVCDFLIATEGEMKKVNWSTRREVIGATKVVIVTIILMSLLLFIVDIIFAVFFSAIGVLKIDIIGRMFGLGEG